MTTPFSAQIDPIILKLAARPGGVALAEVPHDQPSNDAVGCRMAKMVKKGLLVSEKIGNNKRYFTNADAAAAALKAHQAKVLPSGSLGFRRDAEVVYTDKTIYTRGPDFKPRFEAITVPHSGLTRGRVTA